MGVGVCCASRQTVICASASGHRSNSAAEFSPSDFYVIFACVCVLFFFLFFFFINTLGSANMSSEVLTAKKVFERWLASNSNIAVLP